MCTAACCRFPVHAAVGQAALDHCASRLWHVCVCGFVGVGGSVGVCVWRVWFTFCVCIRETIDRLVLAYIAYIQIVQTPACVSSALGAASI